MGKRAIDNIALKFGYNEQVFAIVIDAGSTGSRILAFTFHLSYIGNFLKIKQDLIII